LLDWEKIRFSALLRFFLFADMGPLIRSFSDVTDRPEDVAETNWGSIPSNDEFK
jgi:hypothetical protein